MVYVFYCSLIDKNGLAITPLIKLWRLEFHLQPSTSHSFAAPDLMTMQISSSKAN